MYIPRLRKIPQAVREIKALDKNTAITEYLVRQLIKKKQITAIKYASVWVINLDEIYAFFYLKEKTNEES